MKWFILYIMVLSGYGDQYKNTLQKFDKSIDSFFKNREIKKIWINKDHLLEEEAVFNLFRLEENGELAGYAYLSSAKGRYDYFDYMVIYNLQLEIEHIKVLVYRSDYGGEIQAKSWLKQLTGKKAGTSLHIGSDVQAISGATISSRSIIEDINQKGEVIRLLTEFNK